MKYEKPEIVAVALATDVIESHPPKSGLISDSMMFVTAGHGPSPVPRSFSLAILLRADAIHANAGIARSCERPALLPP
jgi:hypothetical protein